MVMSTPGAKGRTGNWGMGVEGEYDVSKQNVSCWELFSPYILDSWRISLDWNGSTLPNKYLIAQIPSKKKHVILGQKNVILLLDNKTNNEKVKLQILVRQASS